MNKIAKSITSEVVKIVNQSKWRGLVEYQDRYHESNNTTYDDVEKAIELLNSKRLLTQKIYMLVCEVLPEAQRIVEKEGKELYELPKVIADLIANELAFDKLRRYIKKPKKDFRKGGTLWDIPEDKVTFLLIKKEDRNED